MWLVGKIQMSQILPSNTECSGHAKFIISLFRKPSKSMISGHKHFVFVSIISFNPKNLRFLRDLLIISDKKRETKDKVLRKVSDALLKFGVYISAKVISKEYENLKNTHFISNIKKEGVVLG